MNLTQPEIDRFYRVWFPLLSYVNKQKKLVDTFEDDRIHNDVSPMDAVVIRNAMWEDDSVRDDFIAKNPNNLSQDDLNLVKSWDHRVEGTFFIFRYLKKHTVFISGDDKPIGYGVLGIVSPIEEIAGPYLPIYVKTVLLPFDDKIIYDSLLSPYPVSFGGGVRSSLNNTYKEIKERENLLTSLLPITPEQQTAKTAKVNDNLLKAFHKDMQKSGLSTKKTDEHAQNIRNFVREFLERKPTPSTLLDVTVDDIEAYAETQQKVNLVSFKRLTWFLRDTGRIYYEDAETILDYIKYS